MKVNALLSGNSGFLGKEIFETLSNKFEIKTIGKNNCDFILNFLKSKPINFHETFDLIIHCAGKAHSIPKSESEKDEFFQINANGTKLLLQSLETCPNLPKSFVFISTVAVYGINLGIKINENTPLSSSEPYGKSKIFAEKLVLEWCEANKVICTILRLPLLIGQNPKGNLKSLIDGIRKGFYVNIDGGKARKSMVLASDVAEFIPNVANIGGIYNLTDGYHPSFYEISNLIASQLGKSAPINLPKFLVIILAKIGDFFGKYAPINFDKFTKITSDLTFDDSKARKFANWNPKSVLENFKIH
jgi:nucleoside-diphosphate-sugar epimerase